GAELVPALGEAAAVAAERERRPHDRRDRDAFELLETRDDPRFGHLQADALHRVAELLSVLGALNRLQAGADQLDLELGEDAALGELAREVQRRLAAHRRQKRVRALALQNAG